MSTSDETSEDILDPLALSLIPPDYALGRYPEPLKPGCRYMIEVGIDVGMGISERMDLLKEVLGSACVPADEITAAAMMCLAGRLESEIRKLRALVVSTTDGPLQ